MTTLQKGDKAPNFEGVNQSGETVALKDFAGKKLVLFFYPKDNTPGCTAEACDFRDNYQVFQQQGYKLLGVSPDSSRSHQGFIKKYDLPFPLLADTEQTVSKAYGVWGEKQMFGRKYNGIFRTTFIIDEEGVIERVIKKVKTKAASEQILNI